MPCIICSHIYPRLPCKSKPFLTDKDIENCNYTSDTKIYAPYLRLVFYNFHHNCPCSDCLVKITCYSNFKDGICSKFSLFVQNNSEVYNECSLKHLDELVRKMW